jgi:hypothetical protein
MRTRQVWVLGDERQAEFAAATHWLTGRSTVRWLGTREQLQRDWAELSTGPAPDWVVLLSSHPGEWQAPDVLQIRTRFPVARLVALLGSWQEGERRSGQPLAGVWSVMWHRWLPFFDREWQALLAGRAGCLASPSTASVPELLLSDRSAESVVVRRVAVCATHPVTRAGLEETLRQLGHEVLGAAGDADVVIWDDPGWSHDQGQSSAWVGLSELLSAVNPQVVLALAAGVRWQEAAAWQALGVGGVLAKPFLLSDLIWWIEHLALVGAGRDPFVPLVGHARSPV